MEDKQNRPETCKSVTSSSSGATPAECLPERPSALAQRLQSEQNLQSNRLSFTRTGSMTMETHDIGIRSSNVAIMPAFPNMGTLVHTEMDIRMCVTTLKKFISSETLFYPFEVLVSLPLPKHNDFMWDFKHNFFLSIMYSQVYRYFFPFNRHNCQLFFITNEEETSSQLECINIPSRTMFRSLKLERPLESILMVAISAYKDYLAFFRLTSKHQTCPDLYKNFCYVPPVWTNKLK